MDSGADPGEASVPLPTGMTKNAPPDERSKVGRLVPSTTSTGSGGLERRWIADEEDRWSLRDLADWFNRESLQIVLDSHSRQATAGAVESTYRRLVEDDGAGATRTPAR